MIEYPNLIPECNVDTVFVEVLGYKRPNHAPNINDVFKIFAKRKSSEKLIGFVDNDKRKPKDFFEFVIKDKINNVSLLKHPDKEHYLVVVSPAMDEFMASAMSFQPALPGDGHIMLTNLPIKMG